MTSTVSILPTVIAKIAALQELTTRRHAFLQHVYPECPGKCDDGYLCAEFSSAGSIREKCWYVDDKCPYVSQKKAEMRTTIFAELAKLAIPAIHRKTLQTPIDTTALKATREWQYKEQPLLLLVGAKGVGKSYAAAHAFLRWAECQLPPDLWQEPAHWHFAAQKLASELCWLHVYKLITDRSVVNLAARAPILVLDDLGSEETTSAVKSCINYVISARYDELLPTIITCNLSIPDFVAMYGDRVMDRIAQDGIIVPCVGENLRHL